MKYTALFLSMLLVGCTAAPDEPSPEMGQVRQEPRPEEITQINQTSQISETSPRNNYYNEELVKNVNHYAKWLAQDLFSNIDFKSANVAIVSSLPKLGTD